MIISIKQFFGEVGMNIYFTASWSDLVDNINLPNDYSYFEYLSYAFYFLLAVAVLCFVISFFVDRRKKDRTNRNYRIVKRVIAAVLILLPFVINAFIKPIRLSETTETTAIILNVLAMFFPIGASAIVFTNIKNKDDKNKINQTNPVDDK